MRLVCSDWSHKSPWTGWHIVTAIYFSVLEAEIPRTRGQKIQRLVRFCFWFTYGHLLAVSSRGRWMRELPGFLLWGHSLHSQGLCSHLLITSQRYHLQTPSQQRLDFNTWISGDTVIPSIALMPYQDPSPVKNLVLQHKFELRVRHNNKGSVILPPGPSLRSAEAITGATSAQLFPLPNLDSSPLPPLSVDSKGTP